MSHSPAAAVDHSHPDADVIVVDAEHGLGWLDWNELWRYRELIWIFALRDIKVRYRQTVVGIAWTVLQPLGQMLAFGVLKNVLSAGTSAEQHAGPIPDAVSTFCGVLLYQLLSGILGVATLCLVDNRQMVTKVYFPRIALPLSCCIRPLLDFSLGLAILVILMVCFRVPPSIFLVMSPLVVLLTVIVGLSIGLWLSALNAHYRDFGHIVPFLLQLGLIVSPAAYEASRVPVSWRWLYFMNPMASLLESFRWAVLGSPLPGWSEIGISLASMAFLLVTGVWYFRRVDRFLADSI